MGLPDLRTLSLKVSGWDGKHKNKNVHNMTEHLPWLLFITEKEPTGWQKHK